MSKIDDIFHITSQMEHWEVAMRGSSHERLQMTDSCTNTLQSEFQFILQEYTENQILNNLPQTLASYIASDPRELANSFDKLQITRKKKNKVYLFEKNKLQRLQRKIIDTRENTRFGHVDIVSENRNYGLYRLCISPLSTIEPHYHWNMSEKELVLSKGLLLQNKKCQKGTINTWKRGQVHSYINTNIHNYGYILCLNKPRFTPAEEILIKPIKQKRAQTKD